MSPLIGTSRSVQYSKNYYNLLNQINFIMNHKRKFFYLNHSDIAVSKRILKRGQLDYFKYFFQFT